MTMKGYGNLTERVYEAHECKICRDSHIYTTDKTKERKIIKTIFPADVSSVIPR